MPLRQLCGAGDDVLGKLCFSTIQPDQILYAGLRDIDEPEKVWIKEQNIFHSTEAEIAPILEYLKSKNIQNLYIHFDVDALNPEDYGHALLPINGGLNITQAVRVIKILEKEFDVVGTSLTEVTAGSQKELEPIKSILDLLVSSLNF